MIKRILIYGSVLAFVSVLVGISFVAPVLLQSQSLTEQEASAALDDISGQYAQSYTEGLLSSFTKAGSEIEDEKTAFFYGKLVQGYELDKPSESTGNGRLAGLVPDMKLIEHRALTLPLQEAGKGITDKEIADFYFDFLKRCGLDN